IGHCENAQADPLSLLDVLLGVQDLLDQGAPHVPVSEQGEVDAFGNPEYLSVHHIDRLVQVALLDHKAHVLARDRIVEQQRDHLVLGQGVEGFVEAPQVQAHYRDHRYILYHTDAVDVLGGIVRFKFKVQHLFGPVRLGLVHHQANAPFGGTLGYDSHTDPTLSQGPEDTGIHPDLAQEPTALQVDQGHMIEDRKGLDAPFPRPGPDQGALTGWVEGVADPQGDVLLDQGDDGLCM